MRGAIMPLVLAVAAVLRVASIFMLKTYRNPNTWEFGEIAHVMRDGHGYTAVLADGVRVPSAYMPPFYPYLLTALWKALGESAVTYLSLELVQAFLGVLLVLYVYRLGCVLFDLQVAYIAAAIVAVWPAFVYLCNEFHSISFYILLGVAAVYYLVRYIEVSRSWRDVVYLGACMGGLLYCRAEIIPLLAVYVCVLLWRCGWSSWRQAAAIVVIAFTCISPWTIRNYRVFGHLVAVSTSAGANLWAGHNPRATGNSTWERSYPTADQLVTLKALMGRADSEVLLDEQSKAYAIEFARTHPLEEIRLAGRKMFYFLLFDPSHAKGRKLSYWGPSLVLLLASLYGAGLDRSRLLVQDLPVLVTVAYAFFLSLAVFALPRYRIAIDPFLALFAANALVAVFSGSRRMAQGSKRTANAG